MRWDSLGEFLALTASFEHLGERYGNAGAAVLGETLDSAISKLLLEGKSPSRKVGELDNRGSHYYLALYWAQALATQTANPELARHFASLAEDLAVNEEKIIEELAAAQGEAMDLGGYYMPDAAKADAAMRPSQTLNGIMSGN